MLKSLNAAIGLAVCLFAAMPAASAAPKWTPLATSDDGNTIIYVDSASIINNDSTIRYQSKVDFVNNKEGYKQLITLVEVKCVEKQENFIKETIYTIDGNSKTVVIPPEWGAVVLGGIGELLFNYVCTQDLYK